MSQHNNHWLTLFFVLCTQITLQAEDQVISYAREEPLFVNQAFPTGLKEEDLGRMQLSDPKLRIAYAFLVRAAMGGPKIVDGRTPEMVAALNDLTRRGDSATPLLLDIMAKNHNTRYEHLIPLIVARIGSIKMAPYLDYLREMIRTRPDEISAAANEVTADLFFTYGTADDVKMMQDLAKKRPFLAPSLERAFDLQRYKNPDRSKPAQTTPELKPLQFFQPTPKTKAPEAKPTSTPNQEPTSSTPWSIVFVLIVAAIGLLWLLLKRRN
jgi:hypothetical protein